MPNLLHYIKEVAHQHFYDIPLNPLDILALTEITYLPFDGLVSNETRLEKGKRLDHVIDEFEAMEQKKKPRLSVSIIPERLQLLGLLKTAKRFKAIKLFAYVHEYDREEEKQFAAMSFKVCQNQVVTVFRGTDDTIIGWKEDFHMSYMTEVPAQQAATRYLTKVASHTKQDLYVAGHSKGGNLAIYASSHLPASYQQRICQIIAYDSPGVHSSVIQSPGYQAIQKKMLPIIPQNSIVGMLLETPQNTKIVKSNAFGLLQHISFSWEVDGTDFAAAPALTNKSLQIDKTLKTWTNSLSEEELKQFFDLLFGILLDAGIEHISDFTINVPKKIQLLTEQQQNLSNQEKEMIDTLFRRLIGTRFQVWKDGLPSIYSSLTDWLS